MAITRMRLLKNKKTNSIKIQKKQIAELLANGNDESARIKVNCSVVLLVNLGRLKIL